MTANPERGLERIAQFSWAIAAGGAVGLLVWRGWSWSAGWTLGAAASIVNYRWLKRVTEALGANEAKQRKAVLLGLRYLLLGGGLYVILKYSPIHLPSVLAGLFVPVAAVVIEILIELIYARS